jgi:uncharacterized protein with PQ loop repeat
MTVPCDPWKERYGQFMHVWAVLAHTWLVIQAVELYQSQNAGGLSVWAFAFYIFSSMLWLIYGVWALRPKNWVIIISSILAIALGALIMVGIIVYQ